MNKVKVFGLELAIVRSRTIIILIESLHCEHIKHY